MYLANYGKAVRRLWMDWSVDWLLIIDHRSRTVWFSKASVGWMNWFMDIPSCCFGLLFFNSLFNESSLRSVLTVYKGPDNIPVMMRTNRSIKQANRPCQDKGLFFPLISQLITVFSVKQTMVCNVCMHLLVIVIIKYWLSALNVRAYVEVTYISPSYMVDRSVSCSDHVCTEYG